MKCHKKLAESESTTDRGEMTKDRYLQLNLVLTDSKLVSNLMKQSSIGILCQSLK